MGWIFLLGPVLRYVYMLSHHGYQTSPLATVAHIAVLKYEFRLQIAFSFVCKR